MVAAVAETWAAGAMDYAESKALTLQYRLIALKDRSAPDPDQQCSDHVGIDRSCMKCEEARTNTRMVAMDSASDDVAVGSNETPVASVSPL